MSSIPASTSLTTAEPTTTRRKSNSRFIFGFVIATVFGLLTYSAWSLIGSWTSADQPLVYYTLARTDLPIEVTTRGNLESQSKTEIRCEVDEVGFDGSGNNGTQILFIVPNGSPVNKGDLLVELDSAPMKERLDAQILNSDRAEAEQIQATVKFENQKTQNETLLAEAKLAVEIADLELKMYESEGEGTHQIAMQELELQIQESKASITEARAGLRLQKTDRFGVETLFKLGYRDKGDVDQARYEYLQSEDALVAAINALANARAGKRKLSHYEYPKQAMELAGTLASAKRQLIQVERDNEALLAQAKAAKVKADRQLATEQARLESYRSQLEKCKIYAPHGGMVVYAVESRRSSVSSIREDTYVRKRQRIINLPDLSKMQVKGTIHESALRKVKPNMPVAITVEALGPTPFKGHVESVASVPNPESWSSSGVKVYETIIVIDDEVSKIKPGMTATMNIDVAQLEDVLTIPVQAVVQNESETWCYVETSAGIERRQVEVGRSNDKFVSLIETADGNSLQEGMRIVLNPMALVDEEESPTAETSPDTPIESEQTAVGG